MKNNNFLIALALCIGLSSTMGFSMQTTKAQSSWWPAWMSWTTAKRQAAAAAQSIRSVLPFGFSKWSYEDITKYFTLLVMGALAMGYNKETVQDALNYALEKAGALTTAGVSAASYVASTAAAHPIIATGVTGTIATGFAKELDKSRTGQLSKETPASPRLAPSQEGTELQPVYTPNPQQPLQPRRFGRQ
jgi:hypothetical protein